MRMLKLLSVCLLAVCLLATLCACGGEPSNPADGSTTTTTSNTTTTTTTKADDKETYTVTVLDAAGAPVVGAMVQLCKDICFPTVTDANGVATWSMEEDEYKVSFAMTPDGFVVEESYYFEDDATEMTITLQAAE